jgi:hemerythrin-like domain-containing protein
MSTETVTFTHEMVVVHRVFRREFALQPDLIRGVPEGDVERAEVVGEATAFLLLGLHHHHTEDITLWPMLLERAPMDAELVHRMEGQHHVVEQKVAEAETLLPEWRRTANQEAGVTLAEVIESLASALVEHMNDEEAHILPVVERHVTQAEWEAFGQKALASFPKDKMILVLGGVLEGATPQERKEFLSKLPLVGRVMWSLAGRRRYQAYMTRVRGR